MRNKNKLWAHEQIHQDSNNFVCTVCGKTFGYKSLLRTHYHRTHAPVTEVFECDICSKVFKEKGNLNAHKRYHSDETPYPCTFCDKNFKMSNDLKKHINRVHLKY